jgi:hypothetical protein
MFSLVIEKLQAVESFAFCVFLSLISGGGQCIRKLMLCLILEALTEAIAHQSWIYWWIIHACFCQYYNGFCHNLHALYENQDFLIRVTYVGWYVLKT